MNMDIKCKRILASIPTNSIDEKTQLPKKMGSGCFIEYKGFTLFLTVYHTVKDYSLNTGIVADFDEDSGAKVFSLGIRPPIIKGSLKNSKKDGFDVSIDDLDFSYVKFNNIPECYFFALDEMGKIISKKRQYNINNQFLMMCQLQPKNTDLQDLFKVVCNVILIQILTLKQCCIKSLLTITT